MGFTRYWTRTEKPLTAEFLGEVERIIGAAGDRGISVRGPLGDGEPLISREEIMLNGDVEREESCETFHLGIREGRCFCKTREKAYDPIVSDILQCALGYGLVVDVGSD